MKKVNKIKCSECSNIFPNNYIMNNELEKNQRSKICIECFVKKYGMQTIGGKKNERKQ